ncbi:MAG: methyltransferase domain-containing protein [Desulfobacterales bacterium]
MQPLDRYTADLEFTLRWQKDGVLHTERLFAPRVNFWRDLLPPGVLEALAADPGRRTVRRTVAPGELLPPYREENLHRLPISDFRGTLADGGALVPRRGRFYPRGLLRGLPGVFPQNVLPFRCLEVGPEGLLADLNHPLAGIALELEVAVDGLTRKSGERGGTSVDWAERLLDGPGMQARAGGRPTDFFTAGAFSRPDERQDALFYRKPRLVAHLDARALVEVQRLYGRLLPPGGRVLDLMGSWISHLPPELPPAELVVLGLNEAELAANPRADRRVVHDLNADPQLPFDPLSFDAVISTVSFEYLVRPREVFAQVARILRPGGIFVQVFSNRFFPPKAVRLWTELHEFERMGLVLEVFRDSGEYGELETFSLRGLPRPADDRHAGATPFSDPLYAVWGKKNASGGAPPRRGMPR